MKNSHELTFIHYVLTFYPAKKEKPEKLAHKKCLDVHILIQYTSIFYKL